jgi:YD repeat-containing protein
MKSKRTLAHILAALIAVSLLGSVARGATIDSLVSFDYILSDYAIFPQKISDQGDIVGTLIGTDGVALGFFYKLRLQRFSYPFSEPNDTGGYTQGRGLNNKRHAVGEYLDGTDGTFHGYMLHHPEFTEFDIKNTLDTIPLGINNAGDFVGTVIQNNGMQLAFASLARTITTFAVPNATATFAYQLNTANAMIGYYIDAGGTTHGYTRDSAGNLTYPIDMPGATGTILFGNNDSNWGVGRYTDESGVTHGLFFITLGELQSFDYPDANYTSINGINKDGFVCGSYADSAGVFHGFWGRVNLNGTSQPKARTTARVPAVQPLAQSEALRIGTAPAF